MPGTPVPPTPPPPAVAPPPAASAPPPPPPPPPPPAHASGLADPLADGPTRTNPRLFLDDGRELSLNLAYAFGRAPVAPAGRPDARPIAVRDAQVSKTHLLVEPSAGGALVTDLHSTNGAELIDPDGRTTRLEPGVATPAGPRTRIRLGSLSIAIML